MPPFWRTPSTKASDSVTGSRGSFAPWTTITGAFTRETLVIGLSCWKNARSSGLSISPYSTRSLALSSGEAPWSAVIQLETPTIETPARKRSGRAVSAAKVMYPP